MKTLLTILLTLSLSISIVNTTHAFTCNFFDHPNSCAREWCKSGCIGATEKYVTQDGTVHPELMVNASGKCRQACYTEYPVAEDRDNNMLEIKGTISMPPHPLQDKETRQLTTEFGEINCWPWLKEFSDYKKGIIQPQDWLGLE